MIRVGTAGWAISREDAAAFPGEGRHLERYARVLDCAEINSSFRRSHRMQVYQRWASQTPSGFRFSAKLPRSVTHGGRLADAHEPLDQFLEEAAGAGDRLAVLLAQFPPSFAFDAREARGFFERLRKRFDGSLVCEPRHASWFAPAADEDLAALRVSRAAVDPAPVPGAARPGGWLGPHRDGSRAVLYHRWHGAPRMYWSRYALDWISQRATQLLQWPADADCWCIFDNTAGGGAIGNALELRAMTRSTA